VGLLRNHTLFSHESRQDLVSNKTGYCLAEVGKQYLVYLPPGVGQCRSE